MENDKIIDSLIKRIFILEEKINDLTETVKQLKENVYANSNTVTVGNNESNTKDYSRYIYNGKEYGKGRLVRAIIGDYCKSHPKITANEVKKVFYREIQGSFGCVLTEEELKRKFEGYSLSDFKVRARFYTDLPIELDNEKIYVCSQWGLSNISTFIEVARKEGFIIEVSER